MSAFGFINDDSSADEFADQSQSSDITFGSIDDIIFENDAQKKDQDKTQETLQTHQIASKKGSRVIGRQNSKNNKKSKDGSTKKQSAASRFAKKPTQGTLPSFAITKTQQNQDIQNSTNSFDSINDNSVSTINVVNTNVETFLSATSSDPEYPLPDSADCTKPQNNSSKPADSFLPSSLDKSLDENSNSAFSFTKTENTQIDNNQEELDFDFGVADKENEDTNNSSASFNLVTPPPKETPVTTTNIFSPKLKQNQSKVADLSISAPNPFAKNSNKTPNLTTNDFSNTISQNNNPFSNPTQFAAKSNQSLEPEDDEKRYIKELENYEKQAHHFYDKMKSLESEINQLQKSQSDALSNDMCEHALQISRTITESHKKLIDSFNGFSTALECAMNLATDAPKRMEEHSKSSQKDIPQLRVRQSAMMKRMTSLVDLQENDKQTLEVERSKVSSTIRSLNQPLSEHRKKHAEMAKKLESQIKECGRPFKERIDLLNEEKASHNKRISELLAEIESHKKSIKAINSKISEEEKNMNKELEVFSPQQKEIQNDERLIVSEAKAVAQKQRELESPFIDLQETVNKRDEEIASLSSMLDKVGHEIHEAEQDVDDSQAASDIISEICSGHANFKVARSVVKSKFDAANKACFDAESRLNQINTEITSISLEKDKSTKRIDEAMSQIPQLESSKKAYVASKNFKGAQQVAKQLKDAQDNLTTAKNLVEKNEAKLKDLQIEEKEIKANSLKLADDVEEIRKELDKTDFDFYSKASDLLLALCSSSPYAAKLLASLKNLVSFACKVTEPPKELTKEELSIKLDELNQQIAKAISEENFDVADSLQKQIDRITVKMERFKEDNA